MKTFKTFTFERCVNKKVGNGIFVREMFRHAEGVRKEKTLSNVKIKYNTFRRYEWQNKATKNLTIILYKMERGKWGGARSRRRCGLRPLACRDRGFESHSGLGSSSPLSVVCCEGSSPCDDLSFFQRSPTVCVFVCVCVKLCVCVCVCLIVCVRV